MKKLKQNTIRKGLHVLWQDYERAVDAAEREYTTRLRVLRSRCEHDWKNDRDPAGGRGEIMCSVCGEKKQ